MSEERVEQVIGGVRDFVANRAADGFDTHFRRASRTCESPIEVMLMAGLYQAAIDDGLHQFMDSRGGPYFCAPEDAGIRLDGRPEEGIFICPQVVIGDYRVDFLVSYVSHPDPTVRFAVECDGHDFHEKTKEQAQRDKARDRILQSTGLNVFRFTGREIYADPVKCGREVCGAARDASWRLYLARSGRPPR
jgi:very-short-patch-repair endonuclease